MGDTSYPITGGGATLPDTPADVLLDADNAGTLVALASGTGAGESISYIDAFQAGAEAAIGAEVAGTALISTGAGVDVTSADVSAFLASANAAAALASIGGSGAPGSGTYAARPSTPALGDAYVVTSGQRLGSVYRCEVAGAWVLDRVLAPTSVVPAFYWDAERAEENGAGVNVITWRDERATSTLSLASNRSAAPTVGTASFGSIAPVEWGANSGALRALETGPVQAQPRTLIVVLASVNGAADRAWAGWGGSAGTARTFTVRTRSTGSGGTTGLSFYGTDPWGTGAMPTTTTPTILSARYSGTQYALRQASLSGLSWSYSISATTYALGTYGIGAASGTLSGIVVGAHPWDTTSYATEPARGEVYAVIVYPRALSEAEEEAIGAALAARFGP